ncbi:MAG: NAD-dependent succinate-semialdehyde dehydrogenase [Aureispira sp.]
MSNNTTVYHSINPFTNKRLASYKEDTWEQILRKIEQADAAYQFWRSQSFEERGQYFIHAAKILRKNKARFAQMITDEMGKPYEQSKAEVEKCAWVCEYYVDNASQFLKSEQIDTDANKTTVIHYQPLGTILQVMPWNFPFWQVFRFAAPTLMAGNVTLLKHAPNVLGCAQLIQTVFEEAGFPKGVFQQVIASHEQVKEILAAETVQGLALTGSVRAGKAVGQLASKHLKVMVLELGGSDPFIVLKDANLVLAAQTAVKSRMHNSGQTCISAKRFIVEDVVADEFLALVKKEIQQLVVGDPNHKTTNISVLARMDLAESLQQQVDQSIALGAKVEIAGGHQIGSSYFQPMLLSNIQKGTPAYEEELFGPVATFFRVKDVEEAIALANDSVFGLAGTVFSQNEELAQTVALRLEAGAVCINKIMSSDPRVPFGGIKESGIGRELGREGIRTFVNLKSIVLGG